MHSAPYAQRPSDPATPCPDLPPPGALTDQSVDELYRVIGDCATTHFIFAKHILPAMRQEPGSSFLFITGGAGELRWRRRRLSAWQEQWSTPPTAVVPLPVAFACQLWLLLPASPTPSPPPLPP